MKSSPSYTNQGINFESNAENPSLETRGLSTKLFEEKIEDIDRDIGRFDAVTKLHSKNISSTGKEK